MSCTSQLKNPLRMGEGGTVRSPARLAWHRSREQCGSMSAQGILKVEHPLLISSGWKQALLLGLVTDKVELRITIEGGGISPG